uniref:Uncharacterized protein n=1 Tax=Anguilla anguilla TaxID=7936 RepID=A0A0E9P9V8_ANGAN
MSRSFHVHAVHVHVIHNSICESFINKNTT